MDRVWKQPKNSQAGSSDRSCQACCKIQIDGTTAQPSQISGNAAKYRKSPDYSYDTATTRMQMIRTRTMIVPCRSGNLQGRDYFERQASLAFCRRVLRCLAGSISATWSPNPQPPRVVPHAGRRPGRAGPRLHLHRPDDRCPWFHRRHTARRSHGRPGPAPARAD